MTSFSLRQVKLRPGEQHREELEVEMSALDFGGQRYLPVPDKVPAAFEITQANTGTVFTLAFTVRLHGPCYRCLGDAVLELPIRAREYQDEKPEDEEMARLPCFATPAPAPAATSAVVGTVAASNARTCGR